MIEQMERIIRSDLGKNKRRAQPADSTATTLRPAPSYRWLPVVIALAVLGFWYLSTRGQSGMAFIVASPQAVAGEFVASVLNGTLFRHVATTLLEIGLGFTAGVSGAFVLGYSIAKNVLIDRALSPYVVGFQAVPIVVIAPALIPLVGPGILTNGIICALIVFFAMLVSTIVGIRNVDPDLRDLMRSLSATRWQTFTRLEIPAALPVLFGGLKISMTLAVAGAIVGEAVSANAGLGFLIYSATYVYNRALVLVGVFTLTALALTLYACVAQIERRFLAWQRRGRA